MKLIYKALGVLLTIMLLLGAVSIVQVQQTETVLAAQPTTIPTTIPFDIQAPGANAPDINNGGVFRSGVAIDGNENEKQLIVEGYSTQTADLFVVQQYDGSELFGIEDDGAIDSVSNVRNFGLPSLITKSFTYTAAAGATYTGFVFDAGEKILVHSVMVNVTTNFDATGDDATLLVGDANDADGYLVLADAELQAADTEGTGFQAGWQGLSADTLGVYLDLNHNAFPIVAPTGGYTITYTLDETSGDTLAGGAATLYLLYTRFY